jgi:hypothetical protein
MRILFHLVEATYYANHKNSTKQYMAVVKFIFFIVSKDSSQKASYQYRSLEDIMQ